MSGPVRLAEGVKCPHCLWGHIRQGTRVITDPDSSDGTQVWYLKCSSDERLACRNWYVDSLEMLESGSYWAVVGNRIRVVPREAE